MGRRLGLAGARYRRLTVLERAENIGRHTAWVCMCSCGARVVVKTMDLRRGHVMSCGCLRSDMRTRKNTTHGESGSRLYNIWCLMIRRCSDTANPNYGGRGISVCEEWRGFGRFREWALGNGYQGVLEIDRIDNDGDYRAENCRWATRRQQNRNSRHNRRLTHRGETKTITEWGMETGLGLRTIASRIDTLGWSVSDALTRPVGRT